MAQEERNATGEPPCAATLHGWDSDVWVAEYGNVRKEESVQRNTEGVPCVPL